MQRQFIGLENIKKKKEDRDYYVYFAVKDKNGKVYGFYTNRNLEGMFFKKKDGTYQQVAGTAQFRMNRSLSGARKQIIDNMLKDKEYEISDDLTEEEYEASKEDSYDDPMIYHEQIKISSPKMPASLKNAAGMGKMPRF